ncbi:MAG: ribonuclease BN (tRNA processing enzyme) [Planctomycetota bacterium]|jgi:ribonuclease BN (tRNA processing enzyme)
MEAAAEHTWIVLGAGSILQQQNYGCAGYALCEAESGDLTLFDCGPGTLRSLANAGFKLEKVKRVVLSHFHLDHVLDLFALAYARRNPSFEAGKLELVGPSGLRKFVEKAGKALGGVERGFDGVHYLEVNPGDKIASKSFPEYRLSTVDTHHKKMSLAWRVDLPNGASVCYSGDTGEERNVAELARDVGLFCCECSFPEELAQPNHLNPAGAARLANHANCQTLLLTHFYPSMDPERAAREAAVIFEGDIEIAQDGSRHVLQAKQTMENETPENESESQVHGEQ